MPDEKSKDKDESLSFFTTMRSVVSSMFGVQSRKNAQQDFKKGKASHFIIAGLIAAAIFVGCIIVAVNVVLEKLT